MNTAEKIQVLEIVSTPQNTSKEQGGRAKAARILVPDGLYDAVAVDCKILRMFGGKKAFLELNLLELVDKPSDVRSIFLAVPILEKYGFRSKLYKLWCVVHERLPRRGERISPHDLVGHVYKIRTRTVTRDEHQKEYLPFMRYSVAEIEEVAVRNYKPRTYNQKPITNNQFPPTGGLPHKRGK